ncbi:MAG: hypothetical protein ACR2MB_08500 [Acidimicrobiales bacterium]
MLIDTDHASVVINGHLVRHLNLDRSRPYQPSGLEAVPPPRLAS